MMRFMLQSSELLPTKMSPSPKNHVHLVRFDGGRVRGAGVVDDKTQLPRCLFSLVTSRDADIHRFTEPEVMRAASHPGM
jgi:hypothetical protein